MSGCTPDEYGGFMMGRDGDENERREYGRFAAQESAPSRQAGFEQASASRQAFR